MKTKSPLVWLIPLVVLLLLLPFLVPSALPQAGAEGNSELPVFEPVTLENPNPGEVPLNDKGIPVYAPHADGFFTEGWGYQDGTIYVRTEERVLKNSNGTNNKVLFTYVQIADPSQLRTASNGNYPSSSEAFASTIAKRVNSVMAINGDWCTGRPNIGVVWRNGKKLRECTYQVEKGYDALIIDTNGDFHTLVRPNLTDLMPYEGKILHAFVFGPALVVNGELQQLNNNEYGSGPGMGLMKNTQRQVICQMGPLQYLIISTEGPEQSRDKSGGFTMAEVAQFAYDCGAKEAYNLDGGSSTWVVLGKERINNLRGQKRPITDIIFFATAEPAPEPTATPEPEAEATAAP